MNATSGLFSSSMELTAFASRKLHLIMDLYLLHVLFYLSWRRSRMPAVERSALHVLLYRSTVGVPQPGGGTPGSNMTALQREAALIIPDYECNSLLILAPSDLDCLISGYRLTQTALLGNPYCAVNRKGNEDMSRTRKQPHIGNL